MTEATYSTGQAAKLLGTSSHHVRRLCESGLIEADLSQGNRWRIPAAEVEGLKRNGLPPIPQPPADDNDAGITPAIAPARRPRPIENPAPPAESDAVLGERDDLTIAETQLKRRRVDLEREEVEDSFRDRKRKADQAAMAEARRKEEQAAAQRRRDWEKSWIQAALAAIPEEAPPEYHLEVYRQTEAVLKGIDSEQHPDITRRVVEAAAYQALLPHFQARRRAQAITDAIQSIPAAAVAQRARAKRLAEAALSKLLPNALPDDLREAAEAAVAPVLADIRQLAAEQRHEAEKAQILDGMRYWQWLEATPAEQEQARAAVTAALDRLPVGSDHGFLIAAKEAALAPIEKAIKRRKAEARRKETASQTAENALYRVDSYLLENYAFDSFSERIAEENRLKKALRPVLVAEILDGMESNDLRAFVEEWIDENVELDDDEPDDDEDDEDEEGEDDE